MTTYMYSTNGSTALKAQPVKRNALKLVRQNDVSAHPLQSIAGEYFAAVGDQSVTSILDDFNGQTIAKTRKERIFALCAGIVGAFALFFFSFGCF